MLRKKILKFIFNRRKIAKVYVWIKNTFNQKNKLRSKGCDLSIGLSVINSLVIDSKGQNNRVVIGDSVKIKDCKIYIRGDNNKVVIGNKSTLRQVDFYIEDSENEISIGSSTHFYGKTHLAAIEGTKIKIGDRCLLSSDLHFRTGDSHSILDLSGERINRSKDIVIEDHIWIGTKVTCLKGVRVSENSVVAATTTLCKEYNESNVVIAGVPGKIVKKQINWSGERKK